ncbi:MAG: hypothetical protein LBD37_05225 [Treponema sp.]|jgi:hypothetical protein|nr:hypothetical protein [Treponema sp.]
MVKQELVQRSPVRIFEQSIHGGLKGGELGIIAAPSGIGKTSVLVQLALDKLLQSKKVIHISYTKHNDYVLAWYENIFDEFTRKKNLENIADVKNDVVKNRVLMKFSQEGLSGEQICRSVRSLILEGGFHAEALIVDGYEFTPQDRDRLIKVRELARDLQLSVWYSCAVQGKEPLYDSRNIPVILTDAADLLDVIIILEPKTDHIALTVSKDRNAFNPEHMALRLDPKTLLILEET